MAKEETKKVEKTERELRWEALVEAYAKRNPVKYEIKKAEGKFDNVPDSFV